MAAAAAAVVATASMNTQFCELEDWYLLRDSSGKPNVIKSWVQAFRASCQQAANLCLDCGMGDVLLLQQWFVTCTVL
jgi:hypothetical protein